MVTAVVPPRIPDALVARVVPAHLHGALTASPWVAARTGDAQIAATVAMLRAASPPAVAGHLAGVTILIDHHRVITTQLFGMNRDDLVVEALAAFGAAWPALGHVAPKTVWRTIETLALHASTLPAALVTLLPGLCGERYTPTREVAVGLAIRAGLRDEIAAAIPADASPRHPLRRALDAIDAARQAPRGVEAVLVRALEAWRETRDPALLPWIALADRECARQREPLVDAEQAAWLAVAVANDPADTGRLLDALCGEDDYRRPARIAALARRALHPRYAEVGELAALLEDATPRAVEAEVLAMLARELGAIERKWKLFDDHAREPGDLALRAVLADALVEAGDPQGELITLQTAIADGVAENGAADRARVLVAQHAARLIGALPAVERDSCRFERGFLVAMRTKATGEQMRAVERHGAWSTVEELACSRGPIPAHLPRLRILEVDEVGALDVFGRRGPHPRVEVIATWRAWVPPDRRMFPALAILAGRYEATELATVRASGIPIGVVYHLRNYELAAFLGARAEGPPLLRLSRGYRIVLPDRHAWQIEIKRGADIAHARVPSLWHQDSQEVLRELARHVRTIHVRTDDEARLRALDVGATLVPTEHDVELTATKPSVISQ